jgi:hypothetical protein
VAPRRARDARRYATRRRTGSHERKDAEVPDREDQRLTGGEIDARIGPVTAGTTIVATVTTVYPIGAS